MYLSISRCLPGLANRLLLFLCDDSQDSTPSSVSFAELWASLLMDVHTPLLAGVWRSALCGAWLIGPANARWCARVRAEASEALRMAFLAARSALPADVREGIAWDIVSLANVSAAACVCVGVRERLHRCVMAAVCPQLRQRSLCIKVIDLAKAVCIGKIGADRLRDTARKWIANVRRATLSVSESGDV